MKQKNELFQSIVFSQVGEIADFRVTIDTSKLCGILIKRGMSIVTLFAEYNENLYRLIIAYSLDQDLSELIENANNLFPIYADDVGLQELHDCITDDCDLGNISNLDGLK